MYIFIQKWKTSLFVLEMILQELKAFKNEFLNELMRL